MITLEKMGFSQPTQKELNASVSLSPSFKLEVKGEGRARTGELTRIQQVSERQFLIDFGQPFPFAQKIDNGRIFVDRDRNIYYAIADFSVTMFGAQVNQLTLKISAAPRGPQSFDELRYSTKDFGLPETVLDPNFPASITKPPGIYDTHFAVAFGVNFSKKENRLNDSISFTLE